MQKGKNQVGYQSIANVTNIDLMFANDIIVQINPPPSPILLAGQLDDQVHKTYVVAVGIVVVLGLPSILTNRIAQLLQATPFLFFKLIMSGFSGGIIVQARYVLFTGQLQAPTALIADTGISINIPQCRFPSALLSSGDTVTELAVYQSVIEFDAIIAYSLAYIEVSHNFYESLHIAIQLNGPHAVEKPNQNLMCSLVLYGYYDAAVAPDSIDTIQSLVQSP
ncbi:MAG: hypothetical protein EZS28_040489, partial [Streblomastix strix]